MIDVNTELIRKAQQGDAEILGVLYEHYHLAIYRYLYYRAGDRQAAEDLTSEVFERMLRFLGGFRPPSAGFQAWLFQIARNLANDHFRRTRGRETVELDDELAAGGAAGRDHAETSSERTLTAETLRQALACLKPDQRDVLILRFVNGMPVHEAAGALHKSEDAIKGLQRRALQALRQILLDWEVGYE